MAKILWDSIDVTKFELEGLSIRGAIEVLEKMEKEAIARGMTNEKNKSYTVYDDDVFSLRFARLETEEEKNERERIAEEAQRSKKKREFLALAERAFDREESQVIEMIMKEKAK